MFEKILIANRGEIACRIIRTARRLGIGTVAVYSEADRDARHVTLADEAVPIGAAPSAESYLVIDRLLEACRTTNAQAVHPGYGFLSENALFVEALEAADITFIGPGAEAIKAMGDKIASKRLANEAEVNVIPGYSDAISDAEEAVRRAEEIGFPVMLKASAGGGGKGMRIATDPTSCRDGFLSAQNEARSSFGDDRVFVERYVSEPRHIEIQIIADHHGNALYLNERECSIQRRHQKIIEEAPSVVVDARMRRAMGEQALALARAVNYRSAGTVEFVVDKDLQFYFLEMNTRLQVEHPITEAITGLDLVELMIRVAAGEKLPLDQTDVKKEGWAIESRIYAEDPYRDFLPSTGRLVRYLEPPGTDGIRVDAGVYEGDEVSIHYDPMIAKLVAWGKDRPEAAHRMRQALDRFYVEGVQTNIPFLSKVMGNARFDRGELTTDFIAQEFPDGVTRDVPDRAQLEPILAMVAVAHHRVVERDARISGTLSGRQIETPQQWRIRVSDRSYPATVMTDEGSYRVLLDGVEFEIATDWQPGQPIMWATVDDSTVFAQVRCDEARYRMAHAGEEVELRVMTPAVDALYDHMPVKAAPDLSHYLLSPMPGLLVSVAVSPGDTVKKGEKLAVVEAMKMENTLRAEQDTVVSALLAQPGDTLEVDQPIIEFERDRE